ncbi:MAG TPA: IS1634 family transposase [Acidimicrobiia bacterium]|nr:IS1634 family transposase [Acidimicrobiia bacterium]
MASIVGKKQGNRTYYYLVESARVGGKPRIVSQQYLGSAEEIAKRLSGAAVGEPARTRHRGFGDLAAVWSVLERLDLAGIVDDVVGPRRGDAAASVGTYMALAVANRVVAPCSKLAFADWWSTTGGSRWVRVSAAALDHRRFWDAMDASSAGQLIECERRLAAAMVTEYGLDLAGLVLDMTNFATFVDSADERNTIAQRGHAKQGRVDLRLVGLGLVVTADGGVPICSHTYAGNRPDVTQFATVIGELSARFGALAADGDGDGDGLTVVYDAGMDSAANQQVIEAAGLHFVGSLVPSNHPDLLAVPARRYTIIDEQRFPGVTAFEATADALGAERRVVVTHSATFHDAQTRGFAQTLTKANRRLTELAERLARGKTRRARAAVEADIAEILRPRWLDRVITWELAGTRPATLRLTWTIDPAAQQRLEEETFGKRVLFTDHDDWPIAEVIAGYRSQADVEAGFRQMKDPHVVSFSPMFHWTDQKIRVHAFYCVAALAVAHLMRREAANTGITMSVRELLATLAGIQETVLLYQGDTGRPRARHMLTDMTPTQQRLFDLDAYAPTR